MPEKTEQHYNNILVEAQKSSNDRLLREMLLWDAVDCDKELNIMATEIRRRLPLEKIARRLFTIAVLMSTFTTAYLDIWSFFDDDEQQVQLGLKTNLSVHVAIIILLSTILGFSQFDNSTPAFQKWVLLFLLFGYIFFTLRSAYKWYKPVYKLIKEINVPTN